VANAVAISLPNQERLLKAGLYRRGKPESQDQTHISLFQKENLKKWLVEINVTKPVKRRKRPLGMW
jgi:hypothetical protein